MPATRRGKEGGGGLASKLFNKFDSDRKYDPFLDTDPVIQDSKEGMEALLSMCNAVEINSLFGALGFVVPCPRAAKEQQIMNYIRNGGRQVEKKFADVLKFCWEGLLYEYLRRVGCPLRDRELDPRHFVMRYWRRSMLDPSVQPGFVPFYAKREMKTRNNIMQEDRDIRDIRAGLLLRENLVKEAEARTRGQHDYRFVLQYFSASRNLHGTLVANVNYLVNEVEQLRANMDHSSESISIMEQQFVELETKYDRVVGGLVHRGAFQLTLESTLYGVIHEGHAALKAAEHKANEVLDSMDTGPERYDLFEDEAADDCTSIIGNTISDTSKSPENAAAAVSFADDSPRHIESDGQETGESAVEQPGSAADTEEEMGVEKWAAPRPQAGSKRTTTSGNQEPQGNSNSSRLGGGGSGGKGDPYLSLEPCLGQVQKTHRRACRRYANQVAELEAQNAALASRAAEATRLEAEAVERASAWEAKHDALTERLAGVEKRATEDLALAEERAAEARSRGLEVAGELREKLERATPTLLELVAGFAPRDTEGPGLDLFRCLGIEPDLYAHLVATKRMFEADLESRAFEVIDAERKIAEAEAAKEEEAAAAAAAAAAGGKKKKGERGRPKSKGGGGDKGKSAGGKSKSRSKSAPAKGAKKAPEKSGAKGAQGGAGKDKKAAERKPSPADKTRASSPAKKGAAGKGAKKKK